VLYLAGETIHNLRMKNKYGCLLFLLSLTLLSGCGDLFKKKVVKDSIGPGRLQADCELVIEDFSRILEDDIASSIKCLEQNLNIFMDVSELGEGNSLSRVALINYLRRNNPELKENAYSIINSVFSLSNLITGESPDFISRNNVKLMLGLVRTFNKHSALHFKNTFGSTSEASLAVHEMHRRRIAGAAGELKGELEAILVRDRGSQIHFLNIMDLARGFIKPDAIDALEKIEGMLFLKKILLGGQPQYINHKELGYLFQKFPQILTVVLDLVRFKYLDMGQSDSFKFVSNSVDQLNDILLHPSLGDRKREALFDIDQALASIDLFIGGEDKKISKYSKLIKEGKRIVSQTKTSSSSNDEEWVTGGDLERILGHLNKVSKQGMAFHRIYNSSYLKSQLDAPQSFFLDPKKYEDYFPLDRIELYDFARIINSYRYMRGESNLPFYSPEFRRNPNAMGEILVFEHFISLAFNYYEGSSSISSLKMREVISKFENELIDLNIMLPRRSRNTAETISLLGSLFQYQSDDNKLLDFNEATEFALTLISAMDAKKVLRSFYREKADTDAACTPDRFDRISPDCFHRYFYEGVCKNYRQHFPRLFESFGLSQDGSCSGITSTPQSADYLTASAKAARFCHVYPDDLMEIEYSESDMMSILMAMMHIETTIARWDTNRNNIMDPDEVMDSFKIYKSVILTMVNLNGLSEGIKNTIAKLIFQYLVKFEKAPDIKKFFRLIPDLIRLVAKKAPASRKTIASILREVSAESNKKAIAAGEKPFDCSWLRDPENIPRD
jgi:hypothetical protein